MPLSRLTQETKDKIKLVKLEFLRHHPENEGRVLSENFLINRALNYYLMDSPYRHYSENDLDKDQREENK